MGRRGSLQGRKGGGLQSKQVGRRGALGEGVRRPSERWGRRGEGRRVSEGRGEEGKRESLPQSRAECHSQGISIFPSGSEFGGWEEAHWGTGWTLHWSALEFGALAGPGRSMLPVSQSPSELRALRGLSFPT